jgi:hypothetical protein
LCMGLGDPALTAINAAPSTCVRKKDVINNFMKLFYNNSMIKISISLL